MQISITARHFDLTNTIRDHIEEACEKLTRYFDHIINVHFVLNYENNRNHVELSLHASHFNLQAKEEDPDMYVAIDATIEKIESQIKKLKEKVTSHQKRNLRDNISFVRANMFKRDTRKIVKTKRIAAEAMTVSEALDAISELKDNYFVFKNLETDNINVLVKKDEQHFKLIEP